MAERQISGPVSEATAGVGGKAQALQRRCRGAPLLRPPVAVLVNLNRTLFSQSAAHREQEITPHWRYDFAQVERKLTLG